MKMMKQLRYLGNQLDEPVPEIVNGSSCESDEDQAIVVEERPMQEIVNGLVTSTKHSPVKKDLTFAKVSASAKMPREMPAKKASVGVSAASASHAAADAGR